MSNVSAADVYLDGPFRRAIARADGLARRTIFEAARSGVGIDQRCLVENLAVPLAVANGSQDPFINLDYFEVLKYANLWEGRCHRLPALEHAPFWALRDDLRRSSTGRSRRPRGFSYNSNTS
jgi:hypothetical protein